MRSGYVLIWIFLVLSLRPGVHAQTDSLRLQIPLSGDTSLHPKVEVFKITPDDEIIPARWDTLLTGFHRYDPVWKSYTCPLKLGNIVSPTTSAFYAEQRPFEDSPGITPYEPYLFSIQQQQFFRVRSPFTQLTYTSGGQKTNQEQMLDVVHTQNINEKLNVGVMMNFLSGEGQYSYQKEGKKSFGLFTSYTGERYTLFASAGSGRITRQENGGVSDPGLIGLAKPKDLPTYLAQASDAKSEIKIQRLDIIQSYAFGTFSKRDSSVGTKQGKAGENAWGRLVYKMHYSKDGRSYKDNFPGSGYYRQVYIDPAKTYDTAFFRSWDHELSLQLQSNPAKRFSLGSRMGLRYEMQKYLQNDFPDTILASAGNNIYEFSVVDSYKDHLINNGAVFGELMNEIGRNFRWKAEGSFYFQGYKTGSTFLGGDIKKSFGRGTDPAILQIHGSLDISRPVYWLNHYFSNHFIWNNDFRFEKRIDARAGFSVPALNLEISGGFAINDQIIYFDSLAMPAQADKAVLAYYTRVNKEFNFWKIRSENVLIFQYTSDNIVLPLPNILFRNSTYFHHIFHFKATGGQLDTELGFDMYYFTGYNGLGFMPATGVFYNRYGRKVGNYPFIDVFLNVKVKRTRIFVKVDHVNANLTGYNYFMIADYPVNPLFLKMGLSWTFYD